MPARAETDWCIDSVGALDLETCYVLPERPTEALLIYLHGIVPPERTSVQKTTFETVVSNTSRRANAAALMPRGKKGLGPKGLEKWWAWPTSEGATRRQGPELVATIREKRQKFEATTGIRFSRVYLAGSSSGAWFVASLALTGGLDADGYGAMSGGAGRATPELARLAPKPFYIGYGTHDSVAAGARQLGEVLRAAGWPVRVAQHPVGHGAKEIYLDEAFAFWQKNAID